MIRNDQRHNRVRLSQTQSQDFCHPNFISIIILLIVSIASRKWYLREKCGCFVTYRGFDFICVSAWALIHTQCHQQGVVFSRCILSVTLHTAGSCRINKTFLYCLMKTTKQKYAIFIEMQGGKNWRIMFFFLFYSSAFAIESEILPAIWEEDCRRGTKKEQERHIPTQAVIIYMIYILFDAREMHWNRAVQWQSLSPWEIVQMCPVN